MLLGIVASQLPLDGGIPAGTGVGAASGIGAAAGILVGFKSVVGTGSGVGAAAAVGASIGGPWTPADLGSALRAWYKFDALTGSNGDPQGAVTDASGNSFNLTQTGAQRPTLAAADLNSLNTLRFTAASQQRYTLSNTILNGGSAGSAYFVFKLVNEAAATGLFHWGADGADSYWPFGGTIYDDFGSTTRKTVGNPTPSLQSYRIVSLYSAASDCAYFIDGGTGGSSGGTSAFFSTGTNTVGWSGSSVYLGINSSFDGLDGWLAEVFFTNAKQSTTDRQKAEGYLAHKWGLTGNLDSAHPYKTTPP